GQRPLADSSQVSSSTGQLQTSSSLSKHQQQHMHIPQPSYSIYGTNMGNYPAHAFPGAPASAGLASLGPQSQDSQMRQPTLHHGMGSSQIGGVSQPMNMMNALKYDSQTSNGESKRFHGGPLPGGHVDVEMWDENPPLVGKASLFEPIGEFILYGCEGYVKVYNFHVAPGDVSLYKKIVEQHGHIPNQSVSHEMNILVSNTRVVLGVTRDVQRLGESLPSRKQLQAWNLDLEIARTLKFHMSWLEEMLSSLETKLESHKATLPAEIAGLEADVAALHMDIGYHKATKDRLAKQATEIAKQAAAAAAAKVEAVGRAIAAKKKLLQEKRDEFAAVS
ncbi:hypothetical protein MKW94_023907, partial [Papaver nudicaule]|nr:hypothetical protein [Papaver nudicaule]